jgi:hypothetical protein
MSNTTYVFDVAQVLGIGTPPLGYVTLRIPDGLSLQVLRDSEIGKKLMHDQTWYDRCVWSTESPPAGTYRLRLPVPGSNLKTAAEQAAMLPADEKLAPVVLVVAALLCIHLQGGPDPLDNGWTRCADQSAGGCHAGLTWVGGRLGLFGYWDDDRYSFLCASSVRHIA